MSSTLKERRLVGTLFLKKLEGEIKDNWKNAVR